jgi:hypothetical protein
VTEFDKLVEVASKSYTMLAPDVMIGKTIKLKDPDRKWFLVTVLPRKCAFGKPVVPVHSYAEAKRLTLTGWKFYDGELAPFGWNVIDEDAMPKAAPVPAVVSEPEVEEEPVGDDWLQTLPKSKENRQRILNLLGRDNVRSESFDTLKDALHDKYPDLTYEALMGVSPNDI